MVQILTRPSALGITAQDEEDIFDLLQASGGMAAKEVAGSLRMDEIEVAIPVHVAERPRAGAVAADRHAIGRRIHERARAVVQVDTALHPHLTDAAIALALTAHVAERQLDGAVVADSALSFDLPRASVVLEVVGQMVVKVLMVSTR